jgi:xanthine dehydrogenase YagS FAD-binding subunit
MMRPFEFQTTASVPEAISLASGDGARYVAGGTTLIDLMKLEVETPGRVVDIHRLPLADITETRGGGARIGAMVSNSAVAQHALIRERHPILAEALLSGASPQLRNMATVGGNLMQRTRCVYFRDPRWACNKRQPGAGCDAQDGAHRNHAILGVSDSCFATHPSDMAVALNALDAVVEIEGATGKRIVPIGEFHLAPGTTPQIETVVRPGELITAVELPAPARKWRVKYRKVRDRESYEFALVAVAAMIAMDGGTIGEARIAFGGVATKPWRARDVEQALAGAPPSRNVFQRAADLAVANARPHRDNRFKVELLKRALVRTLGELTEAV